MNDVMSESLVKPNKTPATMVDYSTGEGDPLGLILGAGIQAGASIFTASLQKEIAEDQIKLQKNIAAQQFTLDKSVSDAQVRLIDVQRTNIDKLGQIDIKVANSNSELKLLENELAKEILLGQLQEKKAENSIQQKTLTIQQENFGLPTAQEITKQQPPVVETKSNTILIIGGIATIAGLGFLFYRKR